MLLTLKHGLQQRRKGLDMATGAAKHGADVTKQLPPEIQRMSRDQLLAEVNNRNRHGVSSDDFLKMTLYFQRQGYGDKSAASAGEFSYYYPFNDPDARREYIESQAATGYTAKLPQWRTLREYEAANPPPPDLGLIVARCGQLRNQLDTAGKDAGYEQWRAVLSILKFTKARWPDIEALTGGHADYDQSTTEWKMGDLSAPFLCDSFSTHKDREICEGCKYRGIIRSPIALAYPREPKRKRGAV